MSKPCKLEVLLLELIKMRAAHISRCASSIDSDSNDGSVNDETRVHFAVWGDV